MADLEPGSKFADYLIEGVIARGGMGVVYRAMHPKLERTVALKVIRPAFAEDDDFRRRFTRESKVAASLDHPNVVPIHDADEHDGLPFLVMRYVDGHDLRTLVREEGRLPPERAARIVAQVASALDSAHAAGLVHRDVKPANVLLTATDHAYLTDFGLSKRLTHGEETTRAGTMLGTLNWIAPEQITGDALGAHTDVYALGCVLFHLLTARVPFPAETEWEKQAAHLTHAPPAPSSICPDLPPEFDAVIGRAMAKDAAYRYPSAGELARAAQAAASGDGAGASTAGASTAGAATREKARRASVAPATTRSRALTEVPRRPMLLRALGDPFALALLLAMILAGALIGQVLAVLGLAAALYAASVTRVWLDDDVRRSIAERSAEDQVPPEPSGRGPAPGPSIGEMAEEAVEKKELIQEAIEAAEFSLPDVSRELDEFESTIRRTAEGAQLIRDELGGSPPDAVARQVGSKMERLRNEMRAMLLELDSLRDELMYSSKSSALAKEGQLAADVRELRIEIREVADDLADTAGEERGLDAPAEP